MLLLARSAKTITLVRSLAKLTWTVLVTKINVSVKISRILWETTDSDTTQDLETITVIHFGLH